SPSRLTIIVNQLRTQNSSKNFEFLCPSDHGLDAILAIHDVDYIEYLKSAYKEWCEEGGNKDGVIPEAFPHGGFTSISRGKIKNLKSSLAKAGMYCFDLSCCITEETWEAVYESAQISISAAKEFIKLNNESVYDKGHPVGVFALCRPPGHHANSNISGGGCFLNNAAIAAKLLINNFDSDGNAKKVVILDIDYHHGNGTQDIFYSQSNPLYVSLHASNDFPWYTGEATEVGEGEGEGYNVNIPLPNETSDEIYCEVLEKVIKEKIAPYGANYLIVSLGVDTYKDDPISGFQMTTDAYKRIGQIIKSTELPTLFVMEGGYHMETLGINVTNVLLGFMDLLLGGDDASNGFSPDGVPFVRFLVSLSNSP
ncbi:20171_t:CDS:2, partial [Dentiscutata erythropus]